MGCRQTRKVALAELIRSGTALRRTDCAASKTRLCWELFSHFLIKNTVQIEKSVDLSCFCIQLACLNTLSSGALVSEMAGWHGTVLHGGHGSLLSMLVPVHHGRPLGAQGGQSPAQAGLQSRVRATKCVVLSLGSTLGGSFLPQVPWEQSEQEEYLLVLF